jgi:predicted nuclease with TOPRIM domain
VKKAVQESEKRLKKERARFEEERKKWAEERECLNKKISYLEQTIQRMHIEQRATFSDLQQQIQHLQRSVLSRLLAERNEHKPCYLYA